jgi:hypothetical protein
MNFSLQAHTKSKVIYESSGKTLNKNTYTKSVGLALNSVGSRAKLGQSIPSVSAIIERTESNKFTEILN